MVLLLQRANDLVRNKIHPTSIISGYRVRYINYFVLVDMVIDLFFLDTPVPFGF